MKRNLTLLAALLMLAAAAAWAEPLQQYVMRLEVLSVNPGAMTGDEKVPAQHWADLIHQGSASKIQSVEYLLVQGREGTMLVGHKDPLVYYDPRDQQFQIQFVDTGLKLNTKVESSSANSVKLDINADFSLLETRRPYGTPPDPLTYPQTSVLQCHETAEDLAFGQSIVLASAHGNFIQPMWRMLGYTGAPPPHRDLLVTLTLDRP